MSKKEELIPIGVRIQKWIKDCLLREAEQKNVTPYNLVRDALAKRYKDKK